MQQPRGVRCPAILGTLPFACLYVLPLHAGDEAPVVYVTPAWQVSSPAADASSASEYFGGFGKHLQWFVIQALREQNICALPALYSSDTQAAIRLGGRGELDTLVRREPPAPRAPKPFVDFVGREYPREQKRDYFSQCEIVLYQNTVIARIEKDDFYAAGEKVEDVSDLAFRYNASVEYPEVIYTYIILPDAGVVCVDTVHLCVKTPKEVRWPSLPEVREGQYLVAGAPEGRNRYTAEIRWKRGEVDPEDYGKLRAAFLQYRDFFSSAAVVGGN